MVAGLAHHIAIPTLHGVDTPAVADDEATNVQLLCQRRSPRRRQDASVAGNLQTQSRQAIQNAWTSLKCPILG